MSFDPQHHDEIEKVGLTADEKLWVMQTSSAMGLSRSAYIRTLILAERLRAARSELWQAEHGDASTNTVQVKA